MLNIFVSHAWADKVLPQFGQLRSELSAYELWIDTAGIAPGQAIRDRITAAIEEADLVIVLWSAAAAASDEVTYELATATTLGKPLIPCLLDETPAANEHLAGLLYVDLTPTLAGALGWRRLQYLLTDVWLAKTEPVLLAGAETPEELAERQDAIQSIKERQAELKAQLSVGQDTTFRSGVQAPGRNASNPYVLNMLDAMKAGLGSDTADETLMGVLTYIGEVLARLPGDDPGSIDMKRTLLLEHLRGVDPDAEHENVQLLRTLLLEWLPPGDHVDPER